MRPALKAGLLAVWRDRDTLQIGIDPRRAIALTGMAAVRGLLSLLDGSRDRTQVLAAAQELGIPAATADRVLTLLAAAGALDDFPAALHRLLPGPARRRLAPELATAALAHGDGDGGARTLARRQETWIRVHGTGGAGLAVAGLLTAAGIGRVTTSGRAAVPGWASPGGTGPGATRPRATGAGATRAGATGRRATGAGVAGAGAAGASGAGASGAGVTMAGATGADGTGSRGTGAAGLPAGLATGLPARARPDLVVLAGPQPPELPAALVSAGIPHLAVTAAEAIGTVGPLVLPGRSACLRCLDLARAERDPAWPVILAQAAGYEPDPPACDATLAAAVAAQAAAQVLHFTDRAAPGDVVTNGTLELVLPDWQWRRRSWRPHPQCRCGRRSEL
jgi:hypothetical protein